jgi:hypothetical protein
LPVRGDTRVDCRGLHLSGLLPRRPRHWASDFGGGGESGSYKPGSGAHCPGGQTRRRARCAAHPPRGPGRTRSSQSSSARVTRALKLLPVERARVRTRRTSPTGNLTVNATVGSGTGTPWGWR